MVAGTDTEIGADMEVTSTTASTPSQPQQRPQPAAGPHGGAFQFVGYKCLENEMVCCQLYLRHLCDKEFRNWDILEPLTLLRELLLGVHFWATVLHDIDGVPVTKVPNCCKYGQLCVMLERQKSSLDNILLVLKASMIVFQRFKAHIMQHTENVLKRKGHSTWNNNQFDILFKSPSRSSFRNLAPSFSSEAVTTSLSWGKAKSFIVVKSIDVIFSAVNLALQLYPQRGSNSKGDALLETLSQAVGSAVDAFPYNAREVGRSYEHIKSLVQLVVETGEIYLAGNPDTTVSEFDGGRKVVDYGDNDVDSRATPAGSAEVDLDLRSPQQEGVVRLSQLQEVESLVLQGRVKPQVFEMLVEASKASGNTRQATTTRVEGDGNRLPASPSSGGAMIGSAAMFCTEPAFMILTGLLCVLRTKEGIVNFREQDAASQLQASLAAANASATQQQDRSDDDDGITGIDDDSSFATGGGGVGGGDAAAVTTVGHVCNPLVPSLVRFIQKFISSSQDAEVHGGGGRMVRTAAAAEGVQLGVCILSLQCFGELAHALTAAVAAPQTLAAAASGSSSTPDAASEWRLNGSSPIEMQFISSGIIWQLLYFVMQFAEHVVEVAPSLSAGRGNMVGGGGGGGDAYTAGQQSDTLRLAVVSASVMQNIVNPKTNTSHENYFDSHVDPPSEGAVLETKTASEILADDEFRLVSSRSHALMSPRLALRHVLTPGLLSQLLRRAGPHKFLSYYCSESAHAFLVWDGTTRAELAVLVRSHVGTEPAIVDPSLREIATFQYSPHVAQTCISGIFLGMLINTPVSMLTKGPQTASSHAAATSAGDPLQGSNSGSNNPHTAAATPTGTTTGSNLLSAIASSTSPFSSGSVGGGGGASLAAFAAGATKGKAAGAHVPMFSGFFLHFRPSFPSFRPSFS